MLSIYSAGSTWSGLRLFVNRAREGRGRGERVQEGEPHAIRQETETDRQTQIEQETEREHRFLSLMKKPKQSVKPRK